MASALLELAERMDVLVAPPARVVASTVRGVCRICGSTVRAPRYRYCSQLCFLVVYGKAAECTLLMRVERERMIARERAAQHLRSAKPLPPSAFDDGAPRVPTEVAARLSVLDQWAAKLRGVA